jgi:digeranylgeranylglycerophospholipid reductase
MVGVDRHRCTYCGGCVSVCRVDALTPAEMRLVVSDDCIDLGDCVLACPVGALRLDPAERAGQPGLYPRHYDVVVVGAGPGGSTAAGVTAGAGLSVLLLEKRQEIGSPVRCAEGVGYDGLVSFIQPDPRWVSARVNKAEITTVVDGDRKTLRAQDGHGYVLERRVFDRVLAERAAQAGAEVRVKTAASGLLMEEDRVGVSIQRGDFFAGGEMKVEARVVIAADGVEAQLGRWARLDVQLPPRDTMVCAQYLLAGIEIDPTCTCYVIGHELAPGGYVWIFPKGEGKANVGLGVRADLWQAECPDGEAVLGYLTRFIEARHALA